MDGIDIDKLSIEITASAKDAKAAVDDLISSVKKLVNALDFGREFANSIKGITGLSKGLSDLSKGLSASPTDLAALADGISRAAAGTAKLASGTKQMTMGMSGASTGVKRLSAAAEGLNKALAGTPELSKDVTRGLESISKGLSTDLGIKGRGSVTAIAEIVGEIYRGVDAMQWHKAKTMDPVPKGLIDGVNESIKKLRDMALELGKVQSEYAGAYEGIYEAIRGAGSLGAKYSLGSPSEYDKDTRKDMLRTLGSGFKFGEARTDVAEFAQYLNDAYGTTLNLETCIENIGRELYELAIAARNATRYMNWRDAIKANTVDARDLKRIIMEAVGQIQNLANASEKMELFEDTKRKNSQFMRFLYEMDKMAAKIKENFAQITGAAFIKDIGGGAMSTMMKNLRTDAIEQFTERVRELPATVEVPLNKTVSQFRSLSDKISDAMRVTAEEISDMRASKEFQAGMKFSDSQLNDIANAEGISETYRRMAANILMAREELAELFVQSEKLNDVAIGEGLSNKLFDALAGKGVSSDVAEIANRFNELNDSIEISAEDIRMWEKDISRAISKARAQYYQTIRDDNKKAEEEAFGSSPKTVEDWTKGFKVDPEQLSKITSGNIYTERFQRVASTLKQKYEELIANVTNGVGESSKEFRKLKREIGDLETKFYALRNAGKDVLPKFKGLEGLNELKKAISDIAEQMKSKISGAMRIDPAALRQIVGDDRYSVSFKRMADNLLQAYDKMRALESEGEKLLGSMDGSEESARSVHEALKGVEKELDSIVKKAADYAESMNQAARLGTDTRKGRHVPPHEEVPPADKQLPSVLNFGYDGGKIYDSTAKETDSLRHYTHNWAETLGEVIEKARGVGETLYPILDKISNKIPGLIAGTITISGKLAKLAAGVTFAPLAAGVDLVRKKVNGMGEAFNRAQRTIAQGIHKATGLIRRMANMLQYMLIRRALYRVLQGVGEAMQLMAQFSVKAGTMFNDSMSNLVADAQWIARSIVAAFEPIVNYVTPIIDMLVTKLQGAMNVLGQFFAALTGQNYYVKAKKTVTDYSKSIDKADKAQKNFLLGIDELNVIPDNSAADASNAIDPGDAFEKADIPDKIKEMADKARDVLKKLFDPLKKAWDAAGDYVKDGFRHMVDSFKKLFEDMGRDFLKVWNQPKTVAMLTELLMALGDILHTIGFIADAFDKAWNHNKIGKKILMEIRDILATVIHHIRIATQDTLAWAKSLDFYPLLNATEYTLRKLKIALDKVLTTLNLIYRDVVLPMMEWFIEDGAPKALRIIGKIMEGIGNLADNFNKAWTKLDFGKKIAKQLTDIFDILLKHANNVANAFVEWSKDVDFEPLLDSFEKLLNSLKPFADFIGRVFEDIMEDAIMPFVQYLIEEAFPKINEAMTHFMDTVDWESLREHLDGVCKGIENVGEALAGGFAIALDNVGQSVAQFVNSDQFKEFLDNIAGFLDRITPEMVANVLTGIANALLEIADVIVKFVNWEPVQWFLNMILDYFEKASADDITNLLKGLAVAIAAFKFAPFVGKGFLNFMSFIAKLGMGGINLPNLGTLSLPELSLGGLSDVITGGLSGIGSNIVAFMTADIAATVTAGSFAAAAATIGAAIVAAVGTWLIGNEVGKKLGAYLFPDDKDLYENFHWTGKDGFFDQMFTGDPFADWKDAFNGFLLMIEDFENNPVIATLESVIGGPFLTAAAHVDKFIKDGGLDKLKTKFGELKTEAGKAWDGIKEKSSDLGTNVKEAFEGMVDGVKNVWGTVKDWFNANVIQPLVNFFKQLWTDVSGFFEQLWNDIVGIWDTVAGWFDSTVIQPVVGSFEKLWTDVSGFFNQLWSDISAVWDTVCGWFNEHVIDPVKNAFDTAAKFIKEKFDALWDGIVDGIKLAVTTVIDYVEDMVNAVVKALNQFFKGLNFLIEKAGDIAGKDWKTIKLIEEVKLPRFAAGGFPEDGLFMANHTELVGKFSNGKTAVANNADILAGIQHAVQDGMTRAMAGYSSQGDMTVKLELDGREIYKSVVNQSRREIMRTGNSSVLGLA